jgi:prevent-host-death family protein
MYNSYVIPVSAAREQLAELVNRVAYRGERITLGRRGKKIAAIVSAEDLELLEALEDAADLRLIAEALADPANVQSPLPWSVIATELAKRD